MAVGLQIRRPLLGPEAVDVADWLAEYLAGNGLFAPRRPDNAHPDNGMFKVLRVVWARGHPKTVVYGSATDRQGRKRALAYATPY